MYRGVGQVVCKQNQITEYGDKDACIRHMHGHSYEATMRTNLIVDNRLRQVGLSTVAPVDRALRHLRRALIENALVWGV